MKIKRFLGIAVAAAVACGMLAGCGGKTADEKGVSIYPFSAQDESLNILLGDVMPFYDDGVMNIYHLQNTRGSGNMYYHPISRLTTTDLVHYTDEDVAVDFEESTTSPDAALGTGSFIKGDDGTYHCFYTGHNAVVGSGLPRVEVIRHAVSRDGQVTWEKDEDFNIYGDSNDFRDPYVYYDGDDEKYYMLITTAENGVGVILRYSADSLDASADEWERESVFFTNDSGKYNMECPSYIEYNGFYYLMYSEQGDNRVTHYRYKTEKDGDWLKFERDCFDATGFYAGRPEKADDKLYCFAWCAMLSGGSTGEFDWGGNLVAHELKQLSSGELTAVMPENVRSAVSERVKHKRFDGEKLDSVEFDGGFCSYAINGFGGKVARMSFTVRADDFAGDFGISFGFAEEENNRLGSTVLAFDAKNSAVAVYNDVSSRARYGSALASMDMAFDKGATYSVDVVIDGEVFVAYIDGSTAVTGRCSALVGNNIAVYTNGAKCAIGDLTFYE